VLIYDLVSFRFDSAALYRYPHLQLIGLDVKPTGLCLSPARKPALTLERVKEIVEITAPKFT
jgi:hypothetical protein